MIDVCFSFRYIAMDLARARASTTTPHLVDRVLDAFDAIVDVMPRRRRVGNIVNRRDTEGETTRSPIEITMSYRECTTCGYDLNTYNSYFCKFCGSSLFENQRERDAFAEVEEIQMLERRFHEEDLRMRREQEKRMKDVRDDCERFLDLPKGLEEYAFRHFDDDSVANVKGASAGGRVPRNMITWSIALEDEDEDEERITLAHDIITGEMEIALNDCKVCRMPYQETDIAQFDMEDRPISIMTKSRHKRTTASSCEWEYELLVNKRRRSRILMSRRHLRMRHWGPIRSLKDPHHSFYVSYDRIRDELYVNERRVCPSTISAEVSEIATSKEWTFEDRVYRLDVFRNANGARLTIDNVKVTEDNARVAVTHLVAFELSKCAVRSAGVEGLEPRAIHEKVHPRQIY